MRAMIPLLLSRVLSSRINIHMKTNLRSTINTVVIVEARDTYQHTEGKRRIRWMVLSQLLLFEREKALGRMKN